MSMDYSLSPENAAYLKKRSQQVPARFRKAFELKTAYLLRLLEQLEKIWQRFPDQWSGLSDAQLADLEEETKKTGGPHLVEGIENSARNEVPSCESPEEQEAYHKAASLALYTLLIHEFIERIEGRETKAGRAVQEFLNEHSEASLNKVLAFARGKGQRHKIKFPPRNR